MVNIDSLWGDDFSIKNTKEADLELLEKTKKPLKVVSSEKSLKSKKTSIEDKLAIIREEVLRILGGYAENTIVIKTKQQLIDYIDKSIQNGIISVDTETDNSLDPITCKLMGPCIYTPGQKNAYIPINHINYVTGERLDWQLTEEDVAEQFKRLENTPIIFHNGKFDYEVIKCTTGVPLKIYWDTMIGARMLNENEKAGLKEQYIAKIDPSIEKYDIEHLFSGIEYAIVDPEIFALYAATDAFMTYKLYEWQLKQFNLPDNKRIFDVFKNVEIPVITVAAQMELDGVEIDKEYATRLSEKYHKKSEELDKLIEIELKKYDSVIAQWRLTPDANYHPPKKAGSGEGKSKAEQLDDPVSISSPTQLAILIYDVLQYKSVDKKMPRGTGEDILVKLNEKYQIPLCDLILQKRGLEKLIGTYIDKLPECVSPKDGRLHAQFNQLGTDCITEDSAVVTSQGVLKITDIVGECVNGDYASFKYDLINENNEIEQTSHKIKFENVPTIKIKLANGFELEGTPNHPVRVLNQNISDFRNNKSKKIIAKMWGTKMWKQLKDISVGDLVLIDATPFKFNQDYIETKFDQSIQNITHKKSTRMPQYFNEDFAEFLGMMHSDGALKTNGGCCRVVLYNEHAEVIKRWEELCLKLFELNPISCYPKSNKIHGYYISGKKLEQLSSYFCTGKRNKQIPKEILISRDSVFYSYLRGCSLDSGYQGEKEELKYNFMSAFDCKAVQQRLLKSGIMSRIRLNVSEKNPNVSVIIPRDQMDKFISYTGTLFRKVEPKTTIKNLSTYHRYYQNQNLFAVPVKVINNSINTVYDFTLPETHSFIANGFICHNTGRFSSSNPNL